MGEGLLGAVGSEGAVDSFSGPLGRFGRAGDEDPLVGGDGIANGATLPALLGEADRGQDQLNAAAFAKDMRDNPGVQLWERPGSSNWTAVTGLCSRGRPRSPLP
ncbi:hypothetical protein [Streptomyces natalensis]|uniref:Uncharacterized protein n=1 Tax=Streptomyces natalensis ATCC 27448 TaxID=1240678 RepID=A0A0D7CL16_9ACTN|nr:hypothetical protein [Streptomyces natalensis]KIZ16751.1 hypothetical protein SNA_17215 [Streptomyces natalensis ATCC 27448]